MVTTKKAHKIKIPEQIKKFNFVLLGGDGKKPIEKAWQKKIHRIDDSMFKQHIKEGKNYGVQSNNSSIIIDGKTYFLVIIDFDKKEFQDKVINQFPETFTTTSGSSKNCAHLWLASDNNRAFKIKDENLNSLADLIGEGNQVVAPGSKHSSGSIYSITKDIPFAFMPYTEIEAILKPHDKTPKKTEKPKKQYAPKGISKDITEQILNSVSMESIFDEFKIDTSKNPTNCFFHSSVGGHCLGWNDETAHCFHCDNSWNKFSLVRDAKNLSDKETFEWFANKAGLSDELKKSRKEFVKQNKPEFISNDLKTFIFDENEIVQSRTFTSHLLNENIFGIGLLLPRTEDLTDKNGSVIGQHQRWRPVIITSDHRGLVVSKWFQTEYKINYDELPYEMRLRWELKDIDDFLHNMQQTKINGKDLFNSINNQYEYYMYYRSKEWYNIHTLWDIGTYLHQIFSAFPIYENRGLMGTAKTKSMVVSSYITLNATDIMTNPSEATLFRETETLRPTKYIDEAEKLFKFTKEGMEAENRVELINASYTRNGSVPRQEKVGNKYYTKWYHVYSPTMISSINGLYGSTENRAISQIHTKAPDTDKRGERDPEDDVNNEKWKKIRNMCYRWALENWKEVYNTYLNFNIETTLKKRDLQIWKPLLVLAGVIDKEKLLPSILSFAEKLSMQRKNDNLVEGSLDHKYLTCLNYLLLNNTSDKIYVDSIRERFNLVYGTNEEKKSNKSISIHLDKLGMKELRMKDRQGAYYQLTKIIFDEIINPLTNDFSESKEKSSQSSQSLINTNKISDECMMNNDEYKKNEKIKCDECDECDENDESPEQKVLLVSHEKINNTPKTKPKKHFPELPAGLKVEWEDPAMTGNIRYDDPKPAEESQEDSNE